MSNHSVTSTILRPALLSMTRRNSPRFLPSTSRHSSASAAPSEASGSPISILSPSHSQHLLKETKFSELRDALSRAGTPARVWSHYTSLLNLLGYERLPLELHQEVLRRCTTSTMHLRVSAARRLLVGNRPINPHIHEGRFQTVIRNIRAIDQQPTLDDYHFILEQFAAVGHHVGAMQVYKELVHVGLLPRNKTFGLCLQAVAHRLTLPILPINRRRLVTQTRKMIGELMSDMQRFDMRFTSVNLDLMIRVLKETADREGFESLMKWGYGIDLANPDCPPLEFLGVDSADSDSDGVQQSLPGLPTIQPFSTAALNTTIDMLGRLGDVSKMVQAFEVLTQPLPQASEYTFSSFDDEDDFGIDIPAKPKFSPPHAPPNTTTYNMLLRHLSRAGHIVLVRHYILQAMFMDRQTDFHLRRAISKTKDYHTIPAPNLAINCGTLLPAFGESNRDKNVGLMRWLSRKIPRILKKKRADLLFYKSVQKGRERMREQEAANPKPLDPSSLTMDSYSNEQPNPSPNAPVIQSPLLPPSSKASLMQRIQWQVSRMGSAFDTDINADMSSPPPPPIKYFDLDLHVRVLERDVEEIESLAQRIEDVLGRTTQRVKERIGRRVWSGKDVYLHTDGFRRKMSRQRWRNIVQFKPRYGYQPAASPSSTLMSMREEAPHTQHSSIPQHPE